jgi:hypothetical protein
LKWNATAQCTNTPNSTFQQTIDKRVISTKLRSQIFWKHTFSLDAKRS